MKIPRMKNSDRIALQVLSTIGIIGAAVKANKKTGLLALLLVPFIGSGLEATSNDDEYHIKIDSRYD